MDTLTYAVDFEVSNEPFPERDAGATALLVLDDSATSDARVDPDVRRGGGRLVYDGPGPGSYGHLQVFVLPVNGRLVPRREAADVCLREPTVRGRRGGRQFLADPYNRGAE